MNVLIYSGLTWNGIEESHCHNLTRILAQNHKVTYLEVPYCKDKTKVHIAWLGDYEQPDNVKLISYGETIKKKAYTEFFWTHLDYGLSYMIKTQLHTIKSFFQNVSKFDTAILYNVYDLPFLLLCKLFRKKVIYAIVDDYTELTPSTFWKRILTFNEKIFIALCDKAFCTAQDLKQKTNKATYIPNSIRINSLSRQTTKNPSVSFRVGYIGAVGKWIDSHSISYAALNTPNIQYDIIGDGENLKDIPNLPNITKHGFIPNKQGLKIIKQCNIAIIPFKLNKITHSVSPIKLFEYFQLGLPVITSPTNELLQYKDIIFFYNNNEELIERIQYLQNNPQICKQKGKQGQEYIKENTWEKLLPKYEELL